MLARYSIIVLAALTISACTYQRNLSGTFVVEGQTFKYTRVNTEDANPLGTGESDDFVYIVTFPDGTKSRTSAHYDSNHAWEERNAIARQWLKKNKPEPKAQQTGTAAKSAEQAETASGD